MADETHNGLYTRYLRLAYGPDARTNRNWDVLDGRALDLARELFANIPAGGDLQGYYPDPTIRDGAVTDAKISDVAWTKITGVPPIDQSIVNVNPTPPTSPSPGQLWWRPDPDGALYVYYQDIDSAQWVPASPSGGGGSGLWLEDNFVLKPASPLVWAVQLPPAGTFMGGVSPSDCGSLRLESTAIRLLCSGMGSTFDVILDGGTHIIAADSSICTINGFLFADGIELDTTIRLGPSGPAPSDGTLQYTGTTFQGRVAGAWVDIPGAGGGGDTLWTDLGAYLEPANFQGVALAQGNRLAWGTPPGTNGFVAGMVDSLWLNSSTAIRCMVQDDYELEVTAGGVAVGPGIGVVPAREALDVNGAAILKAATNGTPIDGTLQYTGTKFQGRVAGAWVDIPGAGGGGAPSGPAGGDLAGTYPNPTIGLLKVTTGALANNAVTNGKLAPTCVFASNINPQPLGADVGKVLTVAAGPALSWAIPSLPDPATLNRVIFSKGVSFTNGIAYNANITVDDSTSLVRVDCGAGPVTVTLPAPVTGRFYFIQKADLSANPIILTVTGGGWLGASPGLKVAADRLTCELTAGYAYYLVLAVNFGVAYYVMGVPNAGWFSNGTVLQPSIGALVQAPSTLPISVNGVVAGGGGVVINMNDSIKWGTGTVKGHIATGGGTHRADFMVNCSDANVQDDITFPSWRLKFDCDADTFTIRRANAGAGGTLATLLTLDSAGTLTLPTAGAAFTAGSLTAKARWMTHPTAGWAMLSANLNITATPAYVQDDATKASWSLRLDQVGDNCVIQRSPAGTPTPANLVVIDAGASISVAGTNVNVGSPIMTNIQTTQAGPATSFHINNGYAPQDAAKASLLMTMDCAVTPNPGFYFYFRNLSAAAGAFSQLALISSAGNLILNGPIGQKSTGTTWANPSDRRIKDSIEDYMTGLEIVTQLQPRTFVYNGKGGSPAGVRGYGFIADEVAAVMPEMIGTTKAQLNSEDEELTDIQTVDQSNLILALVNGMQELAARVAALEAA